MPFIHVDEITILQPDGRCEITGETARYVAQVLRHRPGDRLTIFDSGGRWFAAEIIAIQKNRVLITARSIAPPDTESPLEIVLCPGVLQGKMMDLVIQKSVELGVSAIAPLITERCQVRRSVRVERWNKIALEAVRQCGRARAPKVSEPVGFAAFLEGIERGRITSGDDRIFMFYEGGGAGLKSLPPCTPGGKVYVLVGPEGGFTAGEAEQARALGAQSISLGGRVLRAETAAITAAALAQFAFGDLG
jgi:16S rRNA (uracil1498-N3)-methyltransferase